MATRRRVFLALFVGSLTVTLLSPTQAQNRVRRIGFLTGATTQSSASQLAAFREGIAALSWVEDRDYVIDARYGEGVAQSVPGLMAELVASQPDVLLVSGDTSARLLAENTRTIPIVFAVAQDPVANGLAASLQRPGGNATGLSTLTPDLGAKRLQLIREAFPRVSNVVLLFEPAGVGSASQTNEIEAAAERLKIRVTPIGLGQRADIEPAFKRGAALGAQGYLVTQGFFMASHRQVISDQSIRLKVPIIFPQEEDAKAGGLMSYGPSFNDNFRRAAAYVDKIFKGAKPGDLSIEQPTKFELVVNMKTAKAMGLKIPQSILLRADRVIE